MARVRRKLPTAHDPVQLVFNFLDFYSEIFYTNTVYPHNPHDTRLRMVIDFCNRWQPPKKVVSESKGLKILRRIMPS